MTNSLNRKRQIKGVNMNFGNQGKLADSLLKEIMEVIYKYDESMYMVSVLGVLRLAEAQLIEDHSESEDD
jgi:hypothetical protein